MKFKKRKENNNNAKEKERFSNVIDKNNANFLILK